MRILKQTSGLVPNTNDAYLNSVTRTNSSKGFLYKLLSHRNVALSDNVFGHYAQRR